MVKKIDSDSFNIHYKKLVKLSSKLQNKETVDVDGLLDIIEEATSSYNICKKKLHAVKKIVDKNIDDLEQLDLS